MHDHGCGEHWSKRFAGRGRSFSFGPGGFHFDFGDGPGDWGGRRGRERKRMFEGGELRLVLLKLIADEPRHGYELIKAIEEMTGELLGFGQREDLSECGVIRRIRKMFGAGKVITCHQIRGRGPAV